MTLADSTMRAIRRVRAPRAVERDQARRTDRVIRRVRREVTEATKELAVLRRQVSELQLRDLDDVARLKALIERVEPYQPLYGLPELIPTPARPSDDRAARIAERLGFLDGVRVLDIGSSLGYMCFYLADRGAITLGWEMNIRNVAVSRAVAEITQVPSRFAARTASIETIPAIQQWKPDAILLLSVLHHLIYYQGLENAQRVVAELAASCPLLIAELARGDEDPALPWSASQPTDPLEIFAGIKGGYRIEPLSEHATHLSGVPRALVAVVPTTTPDQQAPGAAHLD